MAKKMLLGAGMAISILIIFTSLPAVADVKVYDANNKYLGILVDAPQNATNSFSIFIPSYGISRVRGFVFREVYWKSIYSN